MAEPGISFRPLERADFPLVARWMAEPHVAEWWGAPSGLDGVEKEYGPSIDGADPTLLFVCLEGASPIGLVQVYRLSDNPDYAEAVGFRDAGGVDLLIGEMARCGVGLGPHIISDATALMWERFPEVTGAMAGPSVRNARSLRAFEKAGFHRVRRVTVPGEDEDEMVLYRARPTTG